MLGLLLRLSDKGEIDREIRTFSGNAGNRYVTVQLLDYPVDYRQPQTSSLARLLCRKEWFKDFFQRGFIYAHTGVLYGNACIQAGCAISEGTDEFPVQKNRSGAYGNASAMGQGIPGVGNEIHQYLFDLAVVCQYVERV